MTGRRVAFFVLAAVLATAVAPVAAGADCPMCAAARNTNGWCSSCNVGYVGQQRIESRWLWHTLDAHGHQIDVDRLACPDCRAAATTGGFCAVHRVGFVGGDAYFSRLTWGLAKIESSPATRPPCPACREKADRRGWCEACGVGEIGSRSVADRSVYEGLVHDLAVLERAIEASKRCEQCAAAIVTDSECPVCRVRYRGGRPDGR